MRITCKFSYICNTCNCTCITCKEFSATCNELATTIDFDRQIRSRESDQMAILKAGHGWFIRDCVCTPRPVEGGGMVSRVSISVERMLESEKHARVESARVNCSHECSKCVLTIDLQNEVSLV